MASLYQRHTVEFIFYSVMIVCLLTFSIHAIVSIPLLILVSLEPQCSNWCKYLAGLLRRRPRWLGCRPGLLMSISNLWGFSEDSPLLLRPASMFLPVKAAFLTGAYKATNRRSPMGFACPCPDCPTASRSYLQGCKLDDDKICTAVCSSISRPVVDKAARGCWQVCLLSPQVKSLNVKRRKKHRNQMTLVLTNILLVSITNAQDNLGGR